MYDEIVDRLNRISQFAPSTGVERGRRVLRNCGNPEKDLKIIHVAGTNGKGSTCAYIAQILQSNGYKTGLFTSPHLVDIRERIKINGQMISKSDFEEDIMLLRTAERRNLRILIICLLWQCTILRNRTLIM